MNILNNLTNKNLKLNKKRTILSIIGIVLTGAMIAGVTTLAVSFQNFMINTEKEFSGDWEVSYQNIEYEKLKTIEDTKEFKDIFLTREISDVQLADKKDELRKIKSYDDKAIEKFNIKLLEGNNPKNENEIIVNKNFIESNKQYKLGSEIKLNLGNMIPNNTNEQKILMQNYVSIEKGNFEVKETKTYKIVGIMSDSSRYSYDIITHLDKTKMDSKDIVNITVNGKTNKGIIEKARNIAIDNKLYNKTNELENNFEYNGSVLMYQGESNSPGFIIALYSVCGILILVIAIGSIIVIYNSFAISVSERIKQFGILASVGATKKQIKKMVIYEGFKLGIIGIPLGILFGIAGIGITLKIVDNIMLSMLNEQINTHLNLYVSYPAIIIAAILIAITIYLSVLIPAKRASKISPIEAIRGTKETKIKARKLKTLKFLRKIYGIEGDLALKNLKRSKKRYRTTVISLVISIVLFLTFNGFVTYMFQGFEALYMDMDIDYQMNVYEWEKSNTEEYRTNIKQIYNKIKQIDGVEKLVNIETINCSTKLNNQNVDNNFKKLTEKNKKIKENFGFENEISLSTYIVKLDDTEYNKYLKEIGLNRLENNKCILVNYVDGIAQYKAEFNIFNYKNNDKITINSNDETKTTDLEIAKVTDKVPYGIMDFTGYVNIIVNEETYNKLYNDLENQYNMSQFYIQGENDKMEEQISNIMNEYEYQNYIQNIQEQMSTMRNLKLIIQIFLYGFIVLISLIGVSNIFNTITTNINLRRREFANLKSIGMTDKSFKKMLNLECVFYGTKALLYGLPIGVLMCYLLTKAFESSVSIMFSIPWNSILISILAVYIVVFITMIYSTKKVKKENIIDVIRDDNL